MTEQEREELIERMANAIGGLSSWHRDAPEIVARAALAVAEPVIREECARIADAAAADYRVYRDHFPHAEGAEQVAAAIREGGKDETL